MVLLAGSSRCFDVAQERRMKTSQFSADTFACALTAASRFAMIMRLHRCRLAQYSGNIDAPIPPAFALKITEAAFRAEFRCFTAISLFRFERHETRLRRSSIVGHDFLFMLGAAGLLIIDHCQAARSSLTDITIISILLYIGVYVLLI